MVGFFVLFAVKYQFGVYAFHYPAERLHFIQMSITKQEDYLTVVGKGEMIRIREKLLPLVRLHNIFNIPETKVWPWEALVVVVESESEVCCLLVDDVLEKREVVIKSLGEGWSHPEGISGGAILGDGKVGLIMDVDGILKLKDCMESQAGIDHLVSSDDVSCASEDGSFIQ